MADRQFLIFDCQLGVFSNRQSTIENWQWKQTEREKTESDSRNFSFSQEKLVFVAGGRFYEVPLSNPGAFLRRSFWPAPSCFRPKNERPD
jgi:hypothetical protein